MFTQQHSIYTEFNNSRNEGTTLEIRTVVASGVWDGCVLTGDGLGGTLWSDGNALYIGLGEVTWVGHSLNLATHILKQERERGASVFERNIDLLPPTHAPTGDQTHSPGVCPDQGSNPQPFGVQDDAPTH